MIQVQVPLFFLAQDTQLSWSLDRTGPVLAIRSQHGVAAEPLNW